MSARCPFAQLGLGRVELFHLPLSTIEMVPDESQNLDESALGQSRCCNERGLDESRKQDKRAPDESLNPDKADGECRPRAIHHRYRDAARSWRKRKAECYRRDGC
jgi:hypothetical protein